MLLATTMHIHKRKHFKYSNTYIAISNRVLDVWVCLNKLLAHCFIFVWGWVPRVLDHTSGKSSNDLNSSGFGHHTASY